MECAHHAGRQAVATCNRCGKGLCSECAERFDPPLCVACLLTHNRGVAIRLAAELAITAFIGVGITVFVGSRAGGTWESGLFLGTIATCAYWGWQFVGCLSSPLAYSSSSAYFGYTITKFIFALCFGLIVTPWQIFKRVKEIYRIKKLEKSIRDEAM